MAFVLRVCLNGHERNADNRAQGMPEDDKDVDGGLSVIQSVREFKKEAMEARQKRDKLNERNEAAYFAVQDWSHKMEGQSSEFLPETSTTVEQMAAFIKNGLTSFGNWFSIKAPNSPIREENMRSLLQNYLSDLADGETLPIKVSDGSKVALLKSLMILKVHGKDVERNQNFKVEGDQVVPTNESQWKLQIDLINPKDFYIDPTGRNLYKIQHVERDLHDVLALAERGVYDKAVAQKLINKDEEPEEQEEERKFAESDKKRINDQPRMRKKVQIDEFWGTLLKADGTVFMERALCTVANDKYLLRGPEEFPFWHGEDPFVVIPLLRVPFSTLHRALYDDAVPLNYALNELFNLTLDGGIASVWGTRQLRHGMLEDPSEVADGIPQGATLTIKDDAPPNLKVLEQVTEGQVPPEALQMFNILKTEHNSAVLTSDIRSGNLPSKQVRATEVAASVQSQATVLDSLTGDMEHGIEQLLRKAWLTILQNADDLEENDVASALTPREQFALASLSPAERFVAMGQDNTFKVNGISQTLARARDFQRLMAYMQAMGTNPITAPALLRRYDPDKILEVGFKSINLDPKEVEREQTDGEDPRIAQDLQIAQGLGLNATQGVNVPGEAGIQSEVNQFGNPSDGGTAA